jgi:hypothetical protein
MKTTTSKLTVPASVNTPSAKATASAPAADLVKNSAKEPRLYKNVTIRKFGYQNTDAGRKTVVVFETQNGSFYTVLAHPAIRWKDKIGTQTNLTVQCDCTPWRLLLRPTAEEEAAYARKAAPAPKAYEVVKLSKADRDFLASF